MRTGIARLPHTHAHTHARIFRHVTDSAVATTVHQRHPHKEASVQGRRTRCAIITKPRAAWSEREEKKRKTNTGNRSRRRVHATTTLRQRGGGRTPTRTAAPGAGKASASHVQSVPAAADLGGEGRAGGQSGHTETGKSACGATHAEGAHGTAGAEAHEEERQKRRAGEAVLPATAARRSATLERHRSALATSRTHAHTQTTLQPHKHRQTNEN